MRLENFYRDARRDDGRKSECKGCASAYLREYRKINAGRRKENGKAYRAANPERFRRYARSKDLKRFGIDEGLYLEMLRAGSGACYLCRSACATGNRLAVDHDHACCPGNYSCAKCIRGLLCFGCNSALGKFGDSQALLLRAIDYLALRLPEQGSLISARGSAIDEGQEEVR